MEQALDQGFQYLVSLEILFAYAQSDLQGVSFGLGTGCEWLSDTDEAGSVLTRSQSSIGLLLITREAPSHS